MSFHKFAWSAAFLVLAAPASAELSAEDVWSDWQAYVAGFGYRITGESRQNGAELSISDVEVTGGFAGAGDGATMRISSLLFTENADGTVTIAFPEVMPIEVTSTGIDGLQTKTSMTYQQDGLIMSASGTATDILYDYAADAMSLVTTALEVNGDVIGGDAGLEVGLADIRGQSTMRLSALREYDQTLTAESLSYTLTSVDPATESSGTLSGRTENLQFTGSGALPLSIVQANDMSAMLAAGFVMEGRFTYQGNATQVNTQTPQGPFALAFTSDSGTLDVAMGPDGLSYKASQQALAAEVTTATFPVPLQFAVAEAGLNLVMPVQKSEEAKDFAIGFGLEDVLVSDMLWGIFDPTGQLPRDPATVLIDLTGKARLLLDYLNPSAAMARRDPDVTPAQVENVDINRFEVSIAGAELTGNGAFIFQEAPEGGAPTPVGGVNLKLVGGNGLLDNLVALKLLPEEEAMGARMMMGLLAVPGGEPDTLTSKIEVNEQWHVFANGQRIQ
jgi:hypothetical protein